ncbi:1-acyl-sn-glycerol-3-phosphate acyltransferase [Sporotomaculum syntrophicum]|uniref:1-acyl-sn-glycerol-3-phosphate acyltransferase n=1 Tax=Sporotomaculum syntrophicum TaxID=182264 RepID=A0A9D2WRY4_9FIRM|nr:lysophospholipid acyltransferase family protein [Sporotomaculum syntrophicum]KAF1086475.1 1-acyl-sn-glycerol-3-phosphate acyltransferase [Sporotomaculum syntrophicum]
MFYSVSKAICLVYLKLVRRLKIIGDPKLPANQGIIVVSNHISYLDPVVVGCILNRRISYMGKAELFKIPVLSFIIKKLGTFPVDREGIKPSSIRRALDLLNDGKVVGIFPEGTRSQTSEMLNPHLGAAMLALKGGVPLLPVALSGTKGFWSQVKVNVGRPMNLTTPKRRKISKEEMEHISRELITEISRLLDIIDK